MPIYDSDGTTSREIDKIYDWNGTTNSQIKEVYDNDGSTSRLVYKDAPDYLFNGGDNTEITGGWSIKKWDAQQSAGGNANGYVNSSSLQAWVGNVGNSIKRVYIHTNKKVNVTDLKTITLTINSPVAIAVLDSNVVDWGINNIGLALTGSIPDAQNTSPTSFGYRDYSTHTQKSPNLGGMAEFTVPSMTKTINVSNVSGEFYVIFVMDAYDCRATDRFTVTKILCTS